MRFKLLAGVGGQQLWPGLIALICASMLLERFCRADPAGRCVGIWGERGERSEVGSGGVLRAVLWPSRWRPPSLHSYHQGSMAPRPVGGLPASDGSRAGGRAARSALRCQLQCGVASLAPRRVQLQKNAAHHRADRPQITRRREQWKKYQGWLDPKRLVFTDETWPRPTCPRSGGCHFELMSAAARKSIASKL